MIRVVNTEYIDLLRFKVDRTQRHAQVVNLAIALNKTYGMQILLLLTIYSLLILLSSHYVVVGIFAFRGKTGLLVINTVLHSFTLIYAWIQVILIISNCEMCQRSVDAFYRELFRLMRESKTLCSNKKLCLYVSMRKTVNFTACGFFNLGYPLITSIIAAATTYLVILVQFSIPKT
ncbi:hypothetical protein GE061_003828 [Apolygus lucorum]|uniref:Gustatory receptor n=1 Tax=Apolygus lucorum TaxID=248454 RepID=A0A8S9X4K3_APOLU|nr:hypothetical protein GE061_003828 [Apolygus lucorum]